MNPIQRPMDKALHRFLATSLLAAAAVLAVPAIAQPTGGPGPMHGGPAAHGDFRGPLGHFSPRLLDLANATPEQRAQIRQIMESARKDMEGQREARRALRQETLRVFSQATVDANAVEALRQKQLAQHDQSSRRMSQAMLEASRVLTPQQRQQVAERMERRQQLFERHRRERQSLDAPKS